MNTKTLMRCDKKLLKELRAIKLTNRESYAEVVKRLLKNESKIKE